MRAVYPSPCRPRADPPYGPAPTAPTCGSPARRDLGFHLQRELSCTHPLPAYPSSAPRSYATVPTIRSDRRHGSDTFRPDFVGNVAPDERRAPFCKPRSGCRRASVGLRLPTVVPFSQVFLAVTTSMVRTKTDVSLRQNVRSGTRHAGNVRLGPYLVEKRFFSQTAAGACVRRPVIGHQASTGKGARRTTV